MSDVFISHARVDRADARALAAILEDLGLDVWWDRDLRSGEPFRTTIQRELDEAKCVLVLWSRDSVASDWVVDEAEHARKRGVYCPATLDGTPAPLGFRSRHTVSLAGWERRREASQFRELEESVTSFLTADEATGNALPSKARRRSRPTRTRPAHSRRARTVAVVLLAITAVTVAAVLLGGGRGQDRDSPSSRSAMSLGPDDIDPQRDRMQLLEWLLHGDPPTRQHIAGLLRQRAPMSREFIEQLIALQGDSNSDVAVAATEALDLLEPPRTLAVRVEAGVPYLGWMKTLCEAKFLAAGEIQDQCWIFTWIAPPHIPRGRTVIWRRVSPLELDSPTAYAAEGEVWCRIVIPAKFEEVDGESRVHSGSCFEWRRHSECE